MDNYVFAEGITLDWADNKLYWLLYKRKKVLKWEYVSDNNLKSLGSVNMPAGE